MKTQSKLITLLFITGALLSSTRLKAQTTPANAFRLGIGLEAADPTGNARAGSNFILGGTIRVQYGLSNNFAVTLTSGAYHFLPIDRPGTDTKYDSYGVIPIKAGIKEFFIPGFYFAAEAGVGIEEDDSGTGPKRFLYSPGLGYANKHWDFSGRYESFGGVNGGRGFGLVGLRLAYGFAL
jgi:hypothetical protein